MAAADGRGGEVAGVAGAKVHVLGREAGAGVAEEEVSGGLAVGAVPAPRPTLTLASTWQVGEGRKPRRVWN